MAAYVRAANDHDAARVAGCFVDDGTVHDEGATHRGAAQIAAWAEETGTRYGFTIEPRAVTGTDAGCRLTATVSGNFPGSPTTLTFVSHYAPTVSARRRSAHIPLAGPANRKRSPNWWLSCFLRSLHRSTGRNS